MSVLGCVFAVAGCSSSVSDSGNDGGVATDTGIVNFTDTGTSARYDVGFTDLGVTLSEGGVVITTPDSGTGVQDTGTTSGVCVPTVARGHEDTNELCSNGIDDDCNGYIDCDDYGCSRTAAVTVCGGSGTDAGITVTDTGVAPFDVQNVVTGPIGPNGGTMSLLHFAAFGDSRPPDDNDTAEYPTSIIQSVFQGIQTLGVPFVVGTGDYQFVDTTAASVAQLTLFKNAEAMYTGYVFHAMGNHECNGQTASNCPNLNEYPNIVEFRSMLQADLPNVYHDFTVTTSLGDAHFIMVAPNAWTTTQQTWLTSALSVTGPRYTFVFMHEPPDASGPPAGATAAESIIDAHTTTLRIYGHTHEYAHQTPNIVITGNAGAPLEATNDHYGFVEVTQRSDGNIVLNEYAIGSPPTLSSSFVVTPAGVVTH